MGGTARPWRMIRQHHVLLTLFLSSFVHSAHGSNDPVTYTYTIPTSAWSSENGPEVVVDGDRVRAMGKGYRGGNRMQTGGNARSPWLNLSAGGTVRLEWGRIPETSNRLAGFSAYLLGHDITPTGTARCGIWNIVYGSWSQDTIFVSEWVITQQGSCTFTTSGTSAVARADLDPSHLEFSRIHVSFNDNYGGSEQGIWVSSATVASNAPQVYLPECINEPLHIGNNFPNWMVPLSQRQNGNFRDVSFGVTTYGEYTFGEGAVKIKWTGDGVSSSTDIQYAGIALNFTQFQFREPALMSAEIRYLQTASTEHCWIGVHAAMWVNPRITNPTRTEWQMIESLGIVHPGKSQLLSAGTFYSACAPSAVSHLSHHGEIEVRNIRLCPIIRGSYCEPGSSSAEGKPCPVGYY